VSTWDTLSQRDYMNWLLGRWQGEERPIPFPTLVWYTPLFEYVLAPAVAAFAFLRDPFWVRHAVTFSLLPVTLLAAFAMLRRAGESTGTALLAVALVAGNIRFLGHALLNVRDFPLAAVYLLVTLGMWLLLQRPDGTSGVPLDRPGRVLALALVAALPYLQRAPVAQHWLVLAVLAAWAAVGPLRRPGTARRFAVLLLVLAGPLMVWALWPTLWDTGPRGFLEAFSLFNRFIWVGRVRLFGTVYHSSALPWWYSIAWIPISWEPISLLAVAAGTVLAAGALALLAARHWRRPFALLTESLLAWVALFTLAPWAAFLVLQPILYDEERHVLFAMPVLAVLAALGLRRLPERVKIGAAALVAVSALLSFAAWGKYAYVYKDPLVPRASNDDFMGDYWGVAAGGLAQALYDHVPGGAWVVVVGPPEALEEELARRATSRLLRAPQPKTFDLEKEGRDAGPFYVAAMNRNGINRKIVADVEAGRAKLVWREPMPGGGTGGIIAYYTGPCPHCRTKILML
jgi:hypothetical protein